VVVWRLLVFAVGFTERAVPSPLVEVRVLGLVELFDGTSVVRLRRAEQTLLAALAARLGDRVPVDVLVEALWPEGPPPSARKTLQGHILRLRRAVGPLAIVERDGGYRLDPELVEVDATRVTRLVASAREALRRGDSEVAIGLLGDVNEAFRGEPYEGVPDTAVPTGEMQRLAELRVAVVEDSAEAQLDRGQGERCVGELEAFVQANPYRERAWGLLMRALYQAGRPADALAAFGRARVLLAAELGIEPGPALRDVEQAILTHDHRLAPAAAASPHPGRSIQPAAAASSVRGTVGDARSPPFAILGKLEVRSRGGAAQVAGRRRRQLLAYLLVNAGGRVSTDGICDAVWEGTPPPGAAATVRTYISQFRRLDVDGPSLAIDAAGSGYDIGLDRAGLDSTCFEDRFRGSAPLEGPERLGALESALALWRGPALVEFRGAEWSDVEASRLERLREVAVKERFDTLLALGRHSDCLADLAAAVAHAPLDEQLSTQLALARYRSGQVSEGLGELSALRRRLADELGISPGADVVELERRMIERSPDLDRPSSQERPGAGGVDRRLPTGTVTFLFTDVEQSTRMLGELGDHGYAEVLAEVRAIISAAVEDVAGVVFGSEGDALFCAFESASAAARAAIDAQRSIGDHRWPLALRVRMGAHAGEALVVNDDYVGATVHVAARIVAAAHGGQVVASDACRSLDPEHAWIDLGRHRLKDVDRSQHLYQLDTGGGRFPPLATAENVPNNLHAPLDPFVGRAEECKRLVALLGEARLVTLVGTGGVGKTRLAIEASRQLRAANPGGVYVIALAQLSLEESIEAVITSTLLEQGGYGIDLWSVASSLIGDDPALMVLDNCEHVLDRVGDVAAELLGRFPTLRVLATSREPLHARGERVRRVEPLSTMSRDGERSAAEELFGLRAEAATGRRLEPSDDEWIRRICVDLDGLPLAIELAASRTTSLAPVDIATRLDNRFALLRSSRAVDDGRHRTIGAVVDWSYELLSPDDRELFNRLSVFGGEFRLDVAEAVAGVAGIASGYVLEGLSHLVDKSLVQLTSTGRGTTYRLLDTLRGYGRARLADAGRLEAAENSLIGWAMAVTARLERDMRTDRQDASLAAAVADRNSIRTALELQLSRGRYLDALRIVASVPLDTSVERMRLIDMLVSRVDTDGNDEVLGRAHLAAANTEFERARYEVSVRHAQLAAVHFDRLGDQRFVAWCLFQESFGSWGTGDIEAARAGFEAARAAFERMDDRIGLANASWTAVMLQPDLVAADRLGEQAEVELRSIDSPFALAHCLEARSLVELQLGRPDRAGPRLTEALSILAASGNAGCSAHSLEAIAALAVTRELDAGMLGVTAELLGAAEQLRVASGHKHRPWELEGKRAALGALRESLAAEVLDEAMIRGRGHNLASATELGHRVVAAAARGASTLRRSSVDRAHG
jgi:predicted ATPase/DNA-binding SARP family transcriptional activator